MNTEWHHLVLVPDNPNFFYLIFTSFIVFFHVFHVSHLKYLIIWTHLVRDVMLFLASWAQNHDIVWWRDESLACVEHFLSNIMLYLYMWRLVIDHFSNNKDWLININIQNYIFFLKCIQLLGLDPAILSPQSIVIASWPRSPSVSAKFRFVSCVSVGAREPEAVIISGLSPQLGVTSVARQHPPPPAGLLWHLRLRIYIKLSEIPMNS